MPMLTIRVELFHTPTEAEAQAIVKAAAQEAAGLQGHAATAVRLVPDMVTVAEPTEAIRFTDTEYAVMLDSLQIIKRTATHGPTPNIDSAIAKMHAWAKPSGCGFTVIPHG